MSGCGGDPINLENVELKSPRISGGVTFDTVALNAIATALGTSGGGGGGGGGVSAATLAAMIADSANTTLRSAIAGIFYNYPWRGIPTPLVPGDQLMTWQSFSSAQYTANVASRLAAYTVNGAVGSYLYIVDASGGNDPDAYPPSVLGYGGTWERCTVSTSGETFARSGGTGAAQSAGMEILWHRTV